MEAVIREAAPENFDGIFELLLELGKHFGDNKPVDGDKILSIYRGFLERTDRLEYVVEADGRLVAMMSLTIDESLYEDRPYMIIEELIVTAGCRGRGIGKRLISLAIVRTLERGCCVFCVETEAANEGATRFYRGRDFDRESILFEMELDRRGAGHN
ncbi:MAG: GNAT family N-acetyltransferase [Actinomycetota bacterium]|nr:GNAT family N-acetyltransferase [Actinomycetota bacterium]